MPFYTLFATQEQAEARVSIGKLFTVRLPNELGKVCITRNESGSWFAFSDTCPHRMATFSQGGYLNPHFEVVCPLHGYVFSLQTGAEITGENCPFLPLYKIELTARGLVLTI